MLIWGRPARSYTAATDTHVLSVVGPHNGGDICVLNADRSFAQLTHVSKNDEFCRV